MSIISQFVEIIESNIIDKNYQLSNHKDDIITYHWSKKNIILDILIKENICAINKDNDIFWFSLSNEDVKDIAPKILEMINNEV